MAYEFVKQKGRVAFYKDGEFDHQQFRGHHAFRDPAAYVVELEAQDAAGLAYAAEMHVARVADVLAYLAIRAERNARDADQFSMEF